MKLLAIGIDGGTKKIIEGMPMPFTQSLLKKSSYRILSEDLHSRGWAEILTGCKGEDNKGFYLMPFCDGTYKFDRSYSKNVMVSESVKPPLWKMLNEKGASVGFLNVPTTGPADEAKGFIVSGGGGGLNSIGDIPDNMYSPEDVRSYLEKNNYIFDIRLPGGTEKISEFIDKISDAEKIQKSTFIELAKDKKPDFGFHCFRMTTEIQYLARYEIERCMREIIVCRNNGEEFEGNSEVQKSLLSYYKALDSNIKEIFDQLDPADYIFLADHSTVMYENDLNLDVWLEDKNYLKLMSKFEWFFSRVKTKLENAVNAYLKNKKRRAFRLPITRFSKGKSYAFGSFYEIGNFACIFLNDKERFGGPVKSESENIDELVEKICEEFNADPVSRKYDLHAEPYRNKYKGSRHSALFPDIKVCKPDTMYASSRFWNFVCDNANLKPFEDDIKNIRYPYTGLKGSDPLFVYSKGLDDCISANDPNDLRLAYLMIERYFSMNSGEGL